MSTTVTPQNSSPMKSDLPPELENLTEEEREEIFSQIDEVATGSGLEKQQGLFAFTPQKKGSIFPLIVNILALFIMAGGIFYADRYFGRQEEQLDVQSDAYLSAEGKIIEEFKKESERKLQAKESEIEGIKRNLQQIEQERESLAASIEVQIEEKEEQLRAEMEAALMEERERLEARGLSDEELRDRLEEFQENRKEELETALGDYRNEMEAELAQKEEELAEAEATAERILEEANRERRQLIEETRAREAELEAELEAERERLTAQTSMAQEELEELSRLRENEQLILDQISTTYLDIKNSLQEGNSSEALDKIEAARSLINSSSFKRVPTLSKRREVDSFLLSTLEEYVNKTQRSSGDTSLLESAKRLSSAKAAVTSAMEALEGGDRYTAQRYFSQALATIPEIETAHQEVNRIDGYNRGERVDELISMAEENRDAGNREEALSRLTAAAAEASPYNSEKAREASLRIEAMLTAEYERQIDELSARLEGVNQELTTAEQELEALQANSQERIGGLETSTAGLEERIQSLEEEKSTAEAKITELQREKSEMERQMTELQQNYSTAKEQTEELRRDLDEAANEIASLVSQTSSTSLLGEAVDRYTDFRENQREFLGSEASTSGSEAQRRFKRFLQSEEITTIFPELPELYERSHSSD